MKHFKTQSVLLLLLCLPFSSIFAQEAKSFTLEDAKSHAVEHHRDIQNAQNDIDIAQQQIVETRGMGLPQVSINGTFNNFLNLPVQVVSANFINPNAPAGETISFKAGTDYSVAGTMQVNQMIFNGSYIVGLQVSNHYKSFQETRAKLTQEDVVFNVIQAYQLASIAKANKRFADTIVILTEELVKKQQNYLDLGLMLQEDMDQLNYSLLSAKNAAVAADVQLQNAMSLLKLSMGYPVSDPIEITDTPEQLVNKNALNTGGNVQNNLQFELMTKQIELSKYNIKNNQFANLPSLNAFFQQTYNAYRNEFNFFADKPWYPQTVWGIQLNVPIFSGLQRHARTSQSMIQLKKDQVSLEQLEDGLKFQEIQAQNNLIGAKAKYQLQLENIALARTIYENEITKENIGKGNSITVTQKHNQLMVAQAQYLGSMVDLFQARLSLDKLYNNIISNQ